MVLLLAISSAFTLGAGDFFGGMASRRARVWPVVLWSNISGLVVALTGAVALSGAVHLSDLLWGAAAGVLGGLSTVCLYQALATSAMSVAAPVSAAVGAAMPVLAGLLSGERPPAIVLLGLVTGLVAIPFVSVGRTAARPALRPLALAVTAGLCLGGFLVLLSQAEATRSLWLLVAARCASIPLVTLVALRQRAGLTLPRVAWRDSALAGALDMTSNVLFVMAMWHGELATVGLLTSLYPVGTALLAHLVLGERIRPAQHVGVLLALGSVVLVALG